MNPPERGIPGAHRRSSNDYFLLESAPAGSQVGVNHIPKDSINYYTAETGRACIPY